MERYPIFLTFKELIAGEKFIAGISGRIRASLVKDEGKYWFYGVNPGGIDDGGVTLAEAQFRFRDSFKKVLQEIAQDCHSFEAFQTEVQNFITETDDAEEKDWLSARQSIRDGVEKPEADIDQLPRITEDSAQVDIIRFEPAQSTVQSNEEYRLGQAA